MRFANQTVIITGASAGIGRSLAIELANQGANVALAARNSEALAETLAACPSGRAIAVPTDVSQPENCQNLIEKTIAAFGSIDILVNNAGIGMLSRFDQVTDLSIFDQVMRVNYLGTVYCTHYALPYLKTSRGLLVAVSSICGKTGIPTRTGYVASKHAMQGFCDTLRIELRGTGVDVLVVSPGFVATDIRQRALGGDGQPLGRSPRDERKGNMTVDECVRQIIEAMKKRKRDHILTIKGKLTPWAKLIVPEWVDRIAAYTARPTDSDSAIDRRL